MHSLTIICVGTLLVTAPQESGPTQAHASSAVQDQQSDQARYRGFLDTLEEAQSDGRKDLTQVSAAVSLLGDHYLRTLAWSVLGKAQAEAADLDGARQSLNAALVGAGQMNRSAEPRKTEHVLGMIARLQAAVGEIDDALETSRGITSTHSRAFLLADLAQAPAKQADWKKVRELFALAYHAAAQCSPDWHASAFAWLATRQAEIGDFVSARSSLQQAIDFQAIDVGQNVRRATLLVDLAEEHARKKGTHGRLHDPQPIEDENWRTKALQVMEPARKRERPKYASYEAYAKAREAFLNENRPRSEQLYGYRRTEMAAVAVGEDSQLQQKIALAFINTDPLPEQRLEAFKWIFTDPGTSMWLLGWYGSITSATREADEKWQVQVRIGPYLSGDLGNIIHTPAQVVETWRYDSQTGQLEFRESKSRGPKLIMVD